MGCFIFAPDEMHVKSINLKSDPFSRRKLRDNDRNLIYSSNKISKDTKWAPEDRLSKFEQSVIVNSMPIFWLFWD